MDEARYASVTTQSLHTPAAPWTTRIDVDVHQAGPRLPDRLFGNFLEHLGFAIDGGVSAQLLSNPVFERQHNLTDRQRRHLREAGTYLTNFYVEGCDPSVLPSHWTPGVASTGFGVAVLNDYSAFDIPLPWAPLGTHQPVSASLGRMGGAIRLIGRDDDEQTPVGIRQGVFLPVQRTLDYTGDLWIRLATTREDVDGVLEAGIRRRLARSGSPTGTVLTSTRLTIRDHRWHKIPLRLELPEGAVERNEPVDFYLQWIPTSSPPVDVLIDRALLFPADHIDGLDPDVIEAVREWNVPLIRWPGGNFVSHYRWRDGVGPQDFRPTRPNYAWAGLEYNFFGTAEFIRFCELVDAEPHLVVNTGTGTPEEAAAWIEYCNGDVDTRMGRLRAKHGHEEPYDVRLWEVGNETFGAWQGGYHGAEENARRYRLFAEAMRDVDPDVELIATGNSFDFVEPGPDYDHTHADGRWHRALIDAAGDDLEYISLHSLPINHQFLDEVPREEAYYSILAQPAVWERTFIPELLDTIDRRIDHTRVGLAVTEWGPLGKRVDLPRVENYGGALYAALFLNVLIRNADRIPIANATALLHGGCIRKVAGQTYVDPQYPVIRKYTNYAGWLPLSCRIEGPVHSVDRGPDIGGPIDDVPYADAVACRRPASESECDAVAVAVVNRHLAQPMALSIHIPDVYTADQVEVSTLAHPDPSAVASPGAPDRFHIRKTTAQIEAGITEIEVPACSITWIHVPLGEQMDASPQ